jgi:Co/Zn/Cd efflux system component
MFAHVGAAPDPRHTYGMDECCGSKRTEIIGEEHRISAIDDCCATKEAELAKLAQHADVRRVLLVVLAINLGMFVAELAAGLAARSSSLIADSADMLGDALVYMLSLRREHGLRKYPLT